MITERPILGIGATGAQGGAVVDAVRGAGWRVRALVRDLQSAGARGLRDQGVELAPGGFDDTASLRSAMQEAYGVFSMQPVSPPNDSGAELRHGAHLVEAALATGVQVFVHSSVARAGRQTAFAGWTISCRQKQRSCIRDLKGG